MGDRIGTRTSTVSGVRLKADLLASGMRVDEGAERLLAQQGKPVLRVRSGSCGGVDLRLPDGVLVNVPIRESFARFSPFVLVAHAGALSLRDSRHDGVCVAVELLPRPGYYGSPAPSGQPMERVGQICSDRLGIGLTNQCRFWDDRRTRCRFCSIGLNAGRGAAEERSKNLEDAVAVAVAAFGDTVVPARHLMLGGGTPDGADAGATVIASTTAAVKNRVSASVYAMLVPPEDLSYLQLLRDSGVDEIGLNIEVFDTASAARHMPGKHQQIGWPGYRAALERCVELFGPVNTRSIMIVGLEPVESTLAGVRELASMGVMPILTPFRPMEGTALAQHPRLDGETLWRVCEKAAEIADQYGVPLGPTCLSCQSNTLTPGGHPLYRDY